MSCFRASTAFFSTSIDTIKRGEPIAGSLQMVGSSINTVFGGVGFFIGNIGGTTLKFWGNDEVGLRHRGLMYRAGETLSDKNASFLAKVGAVFEWFGGTPFCHYPSGWAPEHARRRHRRAASAS